MLPREGDQPDVAHVSKVVDYPFDDVEDDGGFLSVDVSVGVWGEEVGQLAYYALGWAVGKAEPGTGPQFPISGGCAPLDAYARLLVVMLNDWWKPDRAPRLVPLGAIVHRDLPLGYHRDRRAPDGTRWNATLLGSCGCTGGVFVVPERDYGVVPDTGRLVVFDGQQLHGVTPFTLGEGGWRVALTVYLGEENAI